MKNFLIYQSSAGSGKTYTLVKEYLKIVLKNPDDFRHTLAVTFTVKATDEMSGRIIETLKLLSEGYEKDLKNDLENETGIKNIPVRAKLILEKILHNYSDFFVSTIDSFFTRILRNFSREIKLQIGYDIELEQNDVLDKMADEMLDEIGTNKELTEYITNFVYNNIEEDKGWKIEKNIKSLGKEILKERYREKKLLFDEKGISDTKIKVNELSNELKTIKYSFENFMLEKSIEAERIMFNNGLEISDFSYGKTGVAGYLLIHLKEGDDYKPGKRALDANNDRGKWIASKSKKIREINAALDDGIEEILDNVIDYYEKHHPEYYSAVAVLNTIYIIGIFEDVERKLRDYRDKNRILFISDINSLLESIISGDNCPFIYEKTGNKFKNFLIDEFQDTSNFQWKNFLPLIINSISENNFSMIVGDVKQAIYRWRNGNMRLMLEQVYTDLSAFKDIIFTDNLKKNFRSFSEITGFNNKFFEIARTKLILNPDKEPGTGSDYPSIIGKTFSSVEQESNEKKKGGYIKVIFYKAKEDDVSPKDKSKIKLLETIEKVLSEGYNLKDISIITRKNTEGNEISNLLAEKGIKVISSDSLLLYNSPKIKLLINAIRYLTNNRDELSKTELLYNYKVHVKKETTELHNIFTDYETEELFTKELPGEFFKYDDKNKVKPILNSLTIYELTENLIQIFGLDKEPDAYLIKFLDVILNYSKKNNNDLSSFLEWWDDNYINISISMPEELDAVKVMTVHKAKGLQNKIVIIPFANWDLNISSGKDLILVSSGQKPFDSAAAYFVKPVKELAESYFTDDYLNEYYMTKVDNLNLLYVAFSRAIERLYVFVPDKKTSNVGKVIEETIIELGERDSIIDGDVFERGEETKKSGEKEKAPKDTLVLSDYISTVWYRKAIIRPKYQKIRILKDDKLSEKILWGVLLHNLLSLIKTEEDIAPAILTMQNDGVISEGTIKELGEKAHKVLKNEAVKKWFTGDWEVKTEAEILLPDGKTLRPDRVIIKDKTACIIDYKTGNEKEDDKKQVVKYAEVLKTMGFEKVEKYLMYINDELPDLIKIVDLEKV